MKSESGGVIPDGSASASQDSEPYHLLILLVLAT